MLEHLYCVELIHMATWGSSERYNQPTNQQVTTYYF